MRKYRSQSWMAWHLQFDWLVSKYQPLRDLDPVHLQRCFLGLLSVVSFSCIFSIQAQHKNPHNLHQLCSLDKVSLTKGQSILLCGRMQRHKTYFLLSSMVLIWYPSQPDTLTECKLASCFILSFSWLTYISHLATVFSKVIRNHCEIFSW